MRTFKRIAYLLLAILIVAFAMYMGVGEGGW